LLEHANQFNNDGTRKHKTGNRNMQKTTYDNAIKALKLARESRNRDAARAALGRAKMAMALVHLGYE
jgi:hypothetical protein